LAAAGANNQQEYSFNYFDQDSPPSTLNLREACANHECFHKYGLRLKIIEKPLY
jgi:hypothetical protein